MSLRVKDPLDSAAAKVQIHQEFKEDQGGAGEDTAGGPPPPPQNPTITTVEQLDFMLNSARSLPNDEHQILIPPSQRKDNVFFNDQLEKSDKHRISGETFIIREDSTFRKRWDIFIIIVALWICVTLPVTIAFSTEIFPHQGEGTLNLIFDIVFVIDMVLNLRTTVKHDLSGEEIADCKHISIHYLKTRFFIDLIATIPLDLLIVGNNKLGFYGEKLRILQVFKLSRILRFFKVIAFLNTTENVKLSLKVFKLIFYLVIYIHLQACAWFYYTKYDQTWFPLLDILQGVDHFYHAPVTFQYCFSLYHSVGILNGDDILPATSHQAIVVSILAFVSEFIHAHILGTIGVLLTSLNRKATKFHEQIEFATTAMKNIKVNSNLERQILEYLTLRQNDLDSQEEIQSLMGMLSPHYKTLITQHLFQKALSNIPAFADSKEVLEYLLQNIEAKQYMAEDYIIKQGQKALSVYVLAQGECEVLVRDHTKKDLFVQTKTPGDLFGEVGLVHNTKRTASIRCKDHCTVGEISAEVFNEMIKHYPEIEQSLIEMTTRYKDHWKMYQIGALGLLEYFQSLPTALKEEIHYRLVLENYEEGAIIFERSSECKYIYFLVSGQIELFVDREGENHTLDILRAGSTIGGFSIFYETPFRFGARAKSSLTLLTLSRDDLLDFAEHSEELEELIGIATDFIEDDDIPACDYTKQQPLKLPTSIKVSASMRPVKNAQQLLLKFRKAVRKAIILNKGNVIKKLKIVELMEIVKQHKKINNINNLEGANNGIVAANDLIGQRKQSIMLQIPRGSAVPRQSIFGNRRPSFNKSNQNILNGVLPMGQRRLSVFGRGGPLHFGKARSRKNSTLQIDGNDSPQHNKDSARKVKRRASGAGRYDDAVSAGNSDESADMDKMQRQITTLSSDMKRVLKLLEAQQQGILKIEKAMNIKDLQLEQSATSQILNEHISIRMSGIIEEVDEDLQRQSTDEKLKDTSYEESSGSSHRPHSNQRNSAAHTLTINKVSSLDVHTDRTSQVKQDISLSQKHEEEEEDQVLEEAKFEEEKQQDNQTISMNISDIRPGIARPTVNQTLEKIFFSQQVAPPSIIEPLQISLSQYDSSVERKKSQEEQKIYRNPLGNSSQANMIDDQSPSTNSQRGMKSPITYDQVQNVMKMIKAARKNESSLTINTEDIRQSENFNQYQDILRVGADTPDSRPMPLESFTIIQKNQQHTPTSVKGAMNLAPGRVGPGQIKKSTFLPSTFNQKYNNSISSFSQETSNNQNSQSILLPNSANMNSNYLHKSIDHQLDRNQALLGQTDKIGAVGQSMQFAGGRNNKEIRLMGNGIGIIDTSQSVIEVQLASQIIHQSPQIYDQKSISGGAQGGALGQTDTSHNRTLETQYFKTDDEDESILDEEFEHQKKKGNIGAFGGSSAANAYNYMILSPGGSNSVKHTNNMSMTKQMYQENNSQQSKSSKDPQKGMAIQENVDDLIEEELSKIQ